ncbi:hypothetical protein ES332_D03G049700v1 [Gossypium tomentosum]|uniref:Uncharacterized protein n=1 Tax=Gossypium tomentosum TaxID=34277 RepID=A0A5D2LJ09_GOSTO|nr:hypothetical protein ES332_D03G049700v1 [Gossypium tomentosum]
MNGAPTVRLRWYGGQLECTKAKAGSWLLRRWDLLGFSVCDFFVLGFNVIGPRYLGHCNWVVFGLLFYLVFIFILI